MDAIQKPNAKAQLAYSEEQSKLRLALIGIGHVAQHQMRALQRIQEMELVEAHDINPEQKEALPSGVRFFGSLSDLIEQSDADIYMISTPTPTHFEVSHHLLECGKAIVIEKPACLQHKEFKELMKYHQQVFVYVAFHAAFASDLEWWLANRDCYSLGRLLGFECEFFDPYIKEGQLQTQSRSLVGSWIDSGINALSVIGRVMDPDMLRLVTANMTKVPAIDCDQIQGCAIFSFDSEGIVGHGIIDTNWTLGINQKTTRLWYEEGEIILNHSCQTVSLCKKNETRLICEHCSWLPRLEGHYFRLFKDVIKCYRSGRGNLEFALPLHNLLLDALTYDARIAQEIKNES